MDQESSFSVKDKVIFLTGGTGILGWTYAQAFVQAGAKLFLTDIEEREPQQRAKELSNRLKGQCHGAVCNIDSEKSISDAVAELKKVYGKVDVVINNASSTGEFLIKKGDVFSDFENYPLEIWNSVLQTSLTGSFLVARECGRLMKENPLGGSIINVSSIYGKVGPDHRIYNDMPFKSFVPYSAAKAGIIGLTKWLATYWGPSKIRVNAVVPGGVFNNQDPEFVKRYSQKTPMGRMADRNDLTGIMIYLASESSQYCTGQEFIVDGGFTAW